MKSEKRKERERLITLWTRSWTEKNNLGIEKVFAPNVHYIRSWGPEYHGLMELEYWFSEKNERSTLVKWNINKFIHEDDVTIFHWYMKEEKKTGKLNPMEGVSLVKWNNDNKINYVQHFACNMHRFDPYKERERPDDNEQQLKRFSDLHE